MTKEKSKIIITVMGIVLIAVLAGCSNTSGDDSTEWGFTQYTYHFLNYSSYKVSVEVSGGPSFTLDTYDTYSMKLTKSSISYTYSPANFVYTDKSSGNIEFHDR